MADMDPREQLPILVIPPKVCRFRKITYPLWSFWANKISWPLVSLYIDVRKAIGPRCGACGRGYWKTCYACELQEFMRQTRLEELRPSSLIQSGRMSYSDCLPTNPPRSGNERKRS